MIPASFHIYNRPQLRTANSTLVVPELSDSTVLREISERERIKAGGRNKFSSENGFDALQVKSKLDV